MQETLSQIKMQEQRINIATKLYDEGFKNVTMVVGSDRVKEFSSLLKYLQWC